MNKKIEKLENEIQKLNEDLKSLRGEVLKKVKNKIISKINKEIGNIKKKIEEIKKNSKKKEKTEKEIEKLKSKIEKLEEIKENEDKWQEIRYLIGDELNELKKLNNLIKNKENKVKKYTKIKDTIIKTTFDDLIKWKFFTGLGAAFGVLGLIILVFHGFSSLLDTSIFFILSIIIVGLIMVILSASKKTHMLLELKSKMLKKPIALFFTNHQKVDWQLVNPEGGIIIDKKYGAFILNEKGSYLDYKTHNIFLVFNPEVATNANVKTYKITQELLEVIKDEKKLGELKRLLMQAEEEDGKLVVKVKDEKKVLPNLNILRENVSFSALKSLLNTLIPHNINSKIEMEVTKRVRMMSKGVNPMSIAVILGAIIGGTVIAIMLLKTYGVQPQHTEVVKQVIVQNASKVAHNVTHAATTLKG